MFTNSDQELTVEEVRALLGPPPIMPGESEQEYWTWWTTFVQPGKAKTFVVWMEVNDLAHLEWEQKRLRHSGPALVRRGLILALSLMLLGRYDGIREKIAKDYFGKDGTEQRRAREIVAGYGITQDQIVAEAMVSRGKEMLIVDRMVCNRATATRHLRKAIGRRAETGRIPPEQTGDQPLGAQGRAN
jgi:hypothetical protein